MNKTGIFCFAEFYITSFMIYSHYKPIQVSFILKKLKLILIKPQIPRDFCPTI